MQSQLDKKKISDYGYVKLVYISKISLGLFFLRIDSDGIFRVKRSDIVSNHQVTISRTLKGPLLGHKVLRWRPFFCFFTIPQYYLSFRFAVWMWIS